MGSAEVHTHSKYSMVHRCPYSGISAIWTCLSSRLYYGAHMFRRLQSLVFL